MPPTPTMSRPALLLLLSAAFCTAAAEPIHVPISLGRRGSAAVGDQRQYAPNLPNQRRATEILDSYHLTLSIGTPPQQFKFVVDLESPCSWVANSSCLELGAPCDSILDVYYPSRSSTVTQISTGNIIHYGSANVSGNFVKDAVRLSPYTVPSQFFLNANKMSADVVAWTSSGILGLAYQQTTQGPSFPMSLFLESKGQLASAEMSFWVNRMDTFEYDENPVGGAFTYGGTNTSLYQGEIDFLPTTAPSNASSWNLDVKGASFSSVKFCTLPHSFSMVEIIIQGTSVQITPGASALSAFSLRSSNISGPASDVAAIWAAVPDAVPSTAHPGYYQFPCSTTVNVSISFGGRLWRINPVDMNIGQVESSISQCLGAIYTRNPSSNTTQTNGTANWIFGTAFMKNVYSVFQPTPFSIGFAELSTQSSNTNSRSARQRLIKGCVTGGVVTFCLLVMLCTGRGRTAATYVVTAPRYVLAWVRVG
ncbi:aspartic peptidase domain-containing protein [Mycena vulgaris]|nr:aspartic peptidase domain-containing protein [Mycena vulgaris]